MHLWSILEEETNLSMISPYMFIGRYV